MSTTTASDPSTAFLKGPGPVCEVAGDTRAPGFDVTLDSAECPHCSTPVEPGARTAPFCCRGCAEVHRLLHDEGLSRYYDLAGSAVAPVTEAANARSLAWLEPLLAAQEKTQSPVCSVELDVQGIHCAACVWLMNELYQRRDGASLITVNPAIGKVRLAWERDRLDVADFIQEVERFGYRFGPSRKKGDPVSRALALRIGICAALAMNIMTFAASFYTGLGPQDGELFELFTWLAMGLTTVVVIVGGWPFFKSSWEGLRRGVLHLDIPIAAGIALAYGTSLVKARDGRGDLAYFDTLAIFVTLMLVGRWLQQRVLERNRRHLLEDAGVEGLVVRREHEERLEVVPASEVRQGDVLMLAPGDLVPIDAELLDERVELSTDWINGESEPRLLSRGDVLPAGGFNAGRSAVRMRAVSTLSDSPLPALLRAGTDRANMRHARLLDGIARWYVPAVLIISTTGFLLWLPVSTASALDVTVALLVVTCPCALGLALPLGLEMALAYLRRSGVYVRSGDLLDRVLNVRKVLFDKTGTLTLGRLELVDESPLDALSRQDRDALYALTARSNHPVSRSISEVLAKHSASFASDEPVVEVPGQGVELVRDGRSYRLGRPGWAGVRVRSESGDRERPGTDFAVDGSVLATFEMRESMRDDARAEVSALIAEGKDVWLVSGDADERVAAAARELGISAERALAARTPQQKADAVRTIDAADTLFVGDGVNDSLAFEAAHTTGSPAVDRPVMPGKADFFLLGNGIGGVRRLLVTAQVLRETGKRTLLLALTYNAIVITASMLGLMTPLRAAIAMPTSSIVVLLVTVLSLSQRRLSRAVSRVSETGADRNDGTRSREPDDGFVTGPAQQEALS